MAEGGGNSMTNDKAQMSNKALNPQIISKIKNQKAK
jgi:hypothetical protein